MNTVAIDLAPALALAPEVDLASVENRIGQILRKNICSIRGISSLLDVTNLVISIDLYVLHPIFAEMINLEHLTISGSLRKIDHLNGLTKLKSVDLSNNKLTDTHGLEGITSLETLKLDHNPISRLTPAFLSSLPSLRSLSLCGSSVAALLPTIEALRALPHLEELVFNCEGHFVEDDEAEEDADDQASNASAATAASNASAVTAASNISATTAASTATATSTATASTSISVFSSVAHRDENDEPDYEDFQDYPSSEDGESDRESMMDEAAEMGTHHWHKTDYAPTPILSYPYYRELTITQLPKLRVLDKAVIFPAEREKAKAVVREKFELKAENPYKFLLNKHHHLPHRRIKSTTKARATPTKTTTKYSSATLSTSHANNCTHNTNTTNNYTNNMNNNSLNSSTNSCEKNHDHDAYIFDWDDTLLYINDSTSTNSHNFNTNNNNNNNHNNIHNNNTCNSSTDNNNSQNHNNYNNKHVHSHNTFNNKNINNNTNNVDNPNKISKLLLTREMGPIKAPVFRRSILSERISESSFGRPAKLTVHQTLNFVPRQFEYHPTISEYALFGSTGGDVVILNQHTNKVVSYANAGNSANILGLSWLHKEPTKFLAGCANGTVSLYDMNLMFQKKFPVTYNFPDFSELTSVHANCNDTHFVASGYLHDVGLFDLITGKRVHTFKDVHADHINVIKFSNHDPNLFATSSFDKTIKLWDLRQPMDNNSPVYSRTSYNGNVMVVFSPDDKYLLASAVDNEVRQYTCSDGRLHTKFETPKRNSTHNYTRSYYMNNGEYIIVGSCDENIVRIYNSGTGRLFREVEVGNLPSPLISQYGMLYVQSLRGDPIVPFNFTVLISYNPAVVTSRLVRVSLLDSEGD